MSPGVLVLHGFTATPECMESLVRPLRKGGFEVRAPLLAGHGTTACDLSKTTWNDWYQGIAAEFEKLEKKTGPVSVAGLSLGGLLGLMLASEFPVERLALLATPLFLSGFLARYLLPVIGKSPLHRIYRYQPKWAGPAINDPQGKRAFKSYTKMPIRSILEIMKLQKEVGSRLKSITVPVLIIHSPHDNTAPYENMATLKENLGSKEIRTVTLAHSNHVLTMDFERERVAREVVKFLGGRS